MSEPLSVILWASRSGMHETSLFGRPLWHWTLSAVQKLRPQRVLLIGDGEASPHLEGTQWRNRERFSASLARLKAKVILMPAELPCIRRRSLSRLVRKSRTGPCRLIAAEEAPPTEGTVIAGSSNELQDALARLPRKQEFGALAKRFQASPFASAPHEELLAVRSVADWALASQILRRRKCEELLAGGTFLDDPSTVHIDPDVRVGRGARIHGWVVIEGASRIGSQCEIGSFSHIVDSEIGAGTVLLDHCFIRSSRIGRGAQIGPFAHMRPESVIGSAAKVGNFVELKKTVLGRGSKAPHLSYLGDSQVGEGVNVGAGTITCNYDGKTKHQTIIDDGAFIGSDVQLVAPVRVGKGAYVAAGSCIVEDVPAESLALARSRQIIKHGRMRKAKKAGS